MSSRAQYKQASLREFADAFDWLTPEMLESLRGLTAKQLRAVSEALAETRTWAYRDGATDGLMGMDLMGIGKPDAESVAAERRERLVRKRILPALTTPADNA